MVLMDMDWLANSETRGTLSQCISELGDSDGFSYKALLPVVNSQELRCAGAGLIRYELLAVFTASGRTADADQTNRAPVKGRRNGTSN